MPRSGLGNGPIGVGVGAWLAVALVGSYELLIGDIVMLTGNLTVTG